MDLTVQTLRQGLNTTLQAVPSKAETLRGIFCAALADGKSTLERPLLAEDQFLSLKALQQLGVFVSMEKGRLEIEGRGGKFILPTAGPLFLGNSGFGLRCLTALACLIPTGSVTLDGSKEMRKRPVGELLAALQAQGIAAESKLGNGCTPVSVPSAQPTGGTIPIDCARSSQFLSGLLMLAPFAAADTRLVPSKKFSSRPFIDLTLDSLRKFGVQVQVGADARGEGFAVSAGQRFKTAKLAIGGDFAGMASFLAAPALVGGKVRVEGLSKTSLQPDRVLLKALAEMGAQVHQEENAVRVEGSGSLQAISMDFNAAPDLVPTVAVLAAFANGKSRLTGIAHLRFKESNRLNAVVRELKRMGISARKSHDFIEVEGGTPKPAAIQTYHDHRIAMAFALAGLKTKGVRILDAGCVEKSFPNFFEELGRLTA